MKFPKIGISAIGYECAEHLDKVLAPWIEFNEKHQNVIISTAHGLFPETASLGFPLLSSDATIIKLKAYEEKGLIKKFSILTEPTFEKDIRNATLKALFDENIDYLWLLDLQDEIYTYQDILNIIKFIQRENYISYFKINFKNYVIDESHYVDDFIAPRIWNNKINGGVKEFYYDNEILFNNGKRAEETSCIAISKNIAFIKHLSWVGSEEYLKRKIQFQKIHYGQCSYKFENGKLQLDNEYYARSNLLKPIIYNE